MNRSEFTIAAQWKDYSEHAVPEGASSTQIEVCKEVFYAAYLSLIAMMLDIARLPDEEADGVFAAIKEEALAYAKNRANELISRCKDIN